MAIQLGNGVDWVLAFFGAILADAIVVPVNTRFTEDEAGLRGDRLRREYVFTPGAALPDGDPLVVDDAGPADPAAIFYTSGTTGFPKGAVTSHENFLSNAETCRRALSGALDGESLRTLISVPLFHVTGCNSQLLLAMYTGGTAVVMPAFEIGAFLRAISAGAHRRHDHGAGHLLAGDQPAGLRRRGRLRRALGRLRRGADRAGPGARLAKAFPQARLGNGFGLTETSSVSTFLPHEFVAHADSVGFPAPVCDVRLDAVGPDGTGELLIRGPNVVSGYWNKPEATAQAFAGGSLHTGDLARMTTRAWSTWWTGQGHDQPRRRERVLRRGRERPGRRAGRLRGGGPGRPGRDDGGEGGRGDRPDAGVSLDVPAVLGCLGEHIADFKIPQYVAVSATPLPRNPGGKLLKRRLREDVDWASAVQR